MKDSGSTELHVATRSAPTGSQPLSSLCHHCSRLHHANRLVQQMSALPRQGLAGVDRCLCFSLRVCWPLACWEASVRRRRQSEAAMTGETAWDKTNQVHDTKARPSNQHNKSNTTRVRMRSQPRQKFFFLRFDREFEFPPACFRSLLCI